MKRWIGIVLSAVAIGAGAAAPVPPGLKSGDTLLFLGDSITHQCLYTRYVTLFYMTRYPLTPLHFYNSGVGGDQAANALKRFEYDVAAMRPACVTVLLGMNDGRYRPLGEPQFGIYKTNMTALVDRLQKETAARIFLLTPSMYDVKARTMRGRPGIPGYNDALVAFGEFLVSLGKERGLPVVNLNRPLVEATAALRRSKPEATLIPGGVHPDPAGHLVMAYTILKAFGVTPVVSKATITVDNARAETERAHVAKLTARQDAVEFDLTENALPFPYRSDARAVLSVLPFTRDLNRQILAVKGLTGGEYRLEIDGVATGRYSADALAEGVNLSENEKTPQYQQALRVKALNDKRTAVMRRVRNFRLDEKRKGYLQADGTYPRMLSKRVRAKDGGIKWVPAPEKEARFQKERKSVSKWLEEIRSLETACYEAARPQPHHYRLVRVPANQ
ncbi:MAG: SGNH/GDSL hydrolase family protein [Kiritimatiellaeota bacterium]|nr:SGNH/GDSL hydrolase family protein [Kiritimatiellota bacterium]